MSKKAHITRANITTAFYGQIAAAISARLILNTARRFVYPYAPAISRGLNVPLPAITSIIAVFQASALFGLLIGPLADRWGYRRMMFAGMWMAALGLLLGALFPHYYWVMSGLFLAGLGKTIFDPALQAYIGRAVPYHHRGRAVGVVEASWGGATLAGVPLIGLLMAQFGWQSGFWGLAAAAFLGGFAVLWVFPADALSHHEASEQHSFERIWRYAANHGPVQGVLLFACFVSISNDAFFVVYGAFLEDKFDFNLKALGLTVVVIGVAEITAEMLTALVGDRVGLHRSVVIGTLVMTVAFLLLPVSGSGHPAWLMANIFIIFCTFEFAIVTAVSFCTEVLPTARATMMAGFYAVSAFGRMMGALCGGWLWTQAGWVPLCLFSAATGGLALVGILWAAGRKPGK